MDPAQEQPRTGMGSFRMRRQGSRRRGAGGSTSSDPHPGGGRPLDLGTGHRSTIGPNAPTGPTAQGSVTPTRAIAPTAGENHPIAGTVTQGGRDTSGGAVVGWGPVPPPPLFIPQSLGPGSTLATPASGASGALHMSHASPSDFSVPVGGAGSIPHPAPTPATVGHLYPQSHFHPHAHMPAHASQPPIAMPASSTGHRISSHMHDLALVSPFSSSSHAPGVPPPPPAIPSPSHYYSPTHAPLPNGPYVAYPGPYGWPATQMHSPPAHSSPHMGQYASPPPPAAFLAHQHNLHRSPASPSHRGSPRAGMAHSPREPSHRKTPVTPPTGGSHGTGGGRMSGSGRGGAGNRSGSGRRFHSHQQHLQQQLGPPVPFRLPGSGTGQANQSPKSPAPSPVPPTVQAIQPPPSPTPNRTNQRHSRSHPAPTSPHLPHFATGAHTPQSPQSPPPVAALPTSSPTSPTPKDLPRLGSTPVSTNRRLAQRQKQIDYGKNTLGYQNYIAAVPKAKRKRADPVTPDKAAECSARSWAAQIKKWRRELHQWDNSANGGGGVTDSRSPVGSPSFSPRANSTHYVDRSSDLDNDHDASSTSSSSSSEGQSPTLAATRRHARHRHSTDAIPPPPLSSSPPGSSHRASPPPSLMHAWPERPHSPPLVRASASSGTCSPPPRSETAWSVADSMAESWGTEQEEAVRRVLTLQGQGDEEEEHTQTRRGVVFQDSLPSPSVESAASTAANANVRASAASGGSAAAPDDLPPYLTPQGYMHYYPPFMLSSSIAGGLPLFRRPRRASDASTTSHGTARSGGRAAAAGRAGGGATGTEYSVSDSEMSVRDDIYAAEYEWAWER